MALFMVSFKTEQGLEYTSKYEDKWFNLIDGTIEMDQTLYDYIDNDMYNQKMIHIQDCSCAMVRIIEEESNFLGNYYCFDLKKEPLTFRKG